MTIAGSDSGGGAGIQADLKTFAALGVHGMSAITAITAQNTLGVTAVQGIDPEVVRAQIEAVVEDIGVDAAKTGMLYSSEIIEVVADEIKKHNLTTVVDPVMIAKSGASLLKQEAVSTLVEKLVPLAEVITPNRMEAEALSEVKVETVDDARRAAKKILEQGAKAVVVKGGHIDTEGYVYDVLCDRSGFKIYEAKRISTKNTHGTGCVFASATAAELAKGNSIEEAVRTAKEFVSNAIEFGLSLGKGHGPVNPTATLHNNAERHKVLAMLREAVDVLESHPEVSLLSPESQSNMGMALPYARSRADVAAIPGRIVRLSGRVKASSHPDFGVSTHVANTILAAMKYDPSIRSAINVRYSTKLIDICRELGMSISYYDRSLEPPEIREKEGMTTAWGAEEAIRKVGVVPDVIYHEGGYGKEPMAVILGKTSLDVVNKVVKVASKFSSR